MHSSPHVIDRWFTWHPLCNHLIMSCFSLYVSLPFVKRTPLLNVRCLWCIFVFVVHSSTVPISLRSRWFEMFAGARHSWCYCSQCQAFHEHHFAMQRVCGRECVENGMVVRSSLQVDWSLDECWSTCQLWTLRRGHKFLVVDRWC